MRLYTHLNFGGNCEAAFRFYEQHLGGRIAAMLNASQVPGARGNAPGGIVHARMEIGGTVLIGNDVPADAFQPMRSVYLYLALDSVAEVERVYALLADGGELFMPLAETFFATRFAALRDRFGVSWSLIVERPMR